MLAHVDNRGHTEWTGSFSDDSEDWTPELEQACQLVRSSHDGKPTTKHLPQ